MISKIDDIYKFLENAGNSDIPAKKVLSLLDEIQLRQLGNKHHLKYDELYRGLALLKDIKSASQFFGDFLYSVIGKENVLIIISFWSSERAEFCTETICGNPTLLGMVQQMVAEGQIYLTMKNGVDDIDILYENRLLEVASLYHFVHKSISEEACAVLEKRINLHRFYSFPISDEKKLIATISIASNDALTEIGFTEVERLIRIARPYLILLYKNQSLDQLNRHYSSVFDAADFAFGLFSSDGHLIKANSSFTSLYAPLGEFGFFDSRFISTLGIANTDSLLQGSEILLDVSVVKSDIVPLLEGYSRGRITPVKPTGTVVTYFLFFLHSRKAELKMLETMKAGEQKYLRIFNHIQDVYFEIKLDGTILEISPSIYHYTQISPAELIGTNILSLYADPKRREEYVKVISDRGRVDNYDLDLRLPDGKLFNSIITASIVDRDKPNERVVGSMVDVTELKKKAKAIVDNEIKFRSLFDNAPIGFMICSIEGEIIEINPSFLSIFGHTYIDRSKEANVLKNGTAISLGLSDVVRKVVSSRKPVFTEIQFTCSDNSIHTFKVKISIIPDQTGASKYILIIAEDITEIKEKEQELELSRERFLDIYNNTSDLIYTMDFHGNFTSVNPVAEKWLGYRFQDLKSRNMSEFISHDSSKRAEEQIILKLANHANHSTYEVTAYTRANDKMTLEINSFLRYKDGKPIEVFGIARDITERKKHEEFMSIALRERERLIMEVHHRVKNNLQLVLSMIKMYMAPYQDPKILRSFKNIIQKILAISTAHEDFYFSTDFKEIEFEKYLNTVITTAIEQFDCDEKTTFSLEADNMMGGIDDIIPIGLIISELISNSLQYGINSNNQVNITVTFCTVNGKRELIFKDDGPGIAKEFLENIDSTMGLSLVKLLAENQLGGSCLFESDENGMKVKIIF